MRRRTQRTRGRRPARGAGFTLIELLIVVVIIGIILALILTAAMEGVRSAEMRATQALITKLEAGISDRVDAIVSTRADANDAHGYLTTAYTGTAAIASNQRAQIAARFDQVKAEIPDV